MKFCPNREFDFVSHQSNFSYSHTNDYVILEFDHCVHPTGRLMNYTEVTSPELRQITGGQIIS